MPRGVRVYLEDMLEAIARVREYTSGYDKARLAEDKRTLDAVIRNLEVLGEAAKCVPDAVRSMAPNIPWRRIAGLRDILIHSYFQIKLDVIWEIIQAHLEPLECGLRQLIAEWKWE